MNRSRPHQPIDPSSLTGKTVLVTGASKGIGAEIARHVGAAGAHVIAHYGKDREGAEAATRAVPDERRFLVQGNFDQREVADRVWREALAWRGRVDVLINNAAVMLWNGGIDEDNATWDSVWARTLQVNVLSPAQLMRRALQHFRAQGGGVIVTISSWVVHRGVSNPDTMAYGASKAAIRSMTQSVARNYAGDGVLAYVIAPGVVDTQMSQAYAETVPGGRAAVSNGLAMGEWVPPADVAQLATYLATGAVRHLSGATLDVNGATYIR